MAFRFVERNPTKEEILKIEKNKIIQMELEKENKVKRVKVKKLKTLNARIKRYVNGVLGLAERRELLSYLNLPGNSNNNDLYSANNINPNLANANNLAYAIWEDLVIKGIIKPEC